MRRLVLPMAVLLLLSACQSALPVRNEGEEESVYSGTLRVALYGGHSFVLEHYAVESARKPYPIHERMTAFLEEHPGVQIEVVDIGNDPDALEALFGDPELRPDIIELNVNEARFAAAGRIESLAERIEEALPGWEGDYAKLIERTEIDGEPYLLPVRSDPMLAVYDRKAFEELGIPEPADGWSAVEFAEAAARLLQAERNVGIPFSLEAVEPFIRGWGGEYASPDHRRVVGYLDSEATVEAFVTYVQMMPALGFGGDPKELASLALMRASELRLLARDEYAGYGLASIPHAGEGVRQNTARVTGLALAKESEQQELAWALMRHIVGDASDEAMDFVARNTLEVEHPAFRTDNPVIAELREWMKREALIARPATFDMFMRGNSYYDSQYPYRTPEQVAAYKDPEAARLDLALLAEQLESWLSFLHDHS